MTYSLCYNAPHANCFSLCLTTPISYTVSIAILKSVLTSLVFSQYPFFLVIHNIHVCWFNICSAFKSTCNLLFTENLSEMGRTRTQSRKNMSEVNTNKYSKTKLSNLFFTVVCDNTFFNLCLFDISNKRLIIPFLFFRIIFFLFYTNKQWSSLCTSVYFVVKTTLGAESEKSAKSPKIILCPTTPVWKSKSLKKTQYGYKLLLLLLLLLQLLLLRCSHTFPTWAIVKICSPSV